MTIHNERIKRLVYLHSHVKVIKSHILALDVLLLLRSWLASRCLSLLIIPVTRLLLLRLSLLLLLEIHKVLNAL
jgi:hypothetical protein